MHGTGVKEKYCRLVGLGNVCDNTGANIYIPFQVKMTRTQLEKNKCLDVSR